MLKEKYWNVDMNRCRGLRSYLFVGWKTDTIPAALLAPVTVHIYIARCTTLCSYCEMQVEIK